MDAIASATMGKVSRGVISTIVQMISDRLGQGAAASTSPPCSLIPDAHSSFAFCFGDVDDQWIAVLLLMKEDGIKESDVAEDVHAQFENNCQRVVVVSWKPYRKIRSMKNVDMFEPEELEYNATRSMEGALSYRSLSQDERSRLLASCQTEAHKLPVMMRTDIIARYYGFSPGTVVQISRRLDAGCKNPSVQNIETCDIGDPYYRVVL